MATITFAPSEIVTAQKAVFRARLHTPNLTEREVTELNALFDKLLEADRPCGRGFQPRRASRGIADAIRSHE